MPSREMGGKTKAFQPVIARTEGFSSIAIPG
ncbi:MAG: hypothetical protein QOG38_675, partial [Hyphomicrobiales bacterium]|nr:hypothetical protein [Hyphomicrobiales bacterium]